VRIVLANRAKPGSADGHPGRASRRGSPRSRAEMELSQLGAAGELFVPNPEFREVCVPSCGGPAALSRDLQRFGPRLSEALWSTESIAPCSGAWSPEWLVGNAFLA